jgi:hypothetical protein
MLLRSDFIFGGSSTLTDGTDEYRWVLNKTSDEDDGAQVRIRIGYNPKTDTTRVEVRFETIAVDEVEGAPTERHPISAAFVLTYPGRAGLWDRADASVMACNLFGILLGTVNAGTPDFSTLKKLANNSVAAW